MSIEESKDTKLPAQEKDFLEQEIYESTEETIKITNENLTNLKSEIFGDLIEDFSSRSLESLYNESKKLQDELSFMSNKLSIDIYSLKKEIKELELYLNNMNPDENEKIETQAKINKQKNKLNILENELNDKKEKLKMIEKEIEKRLENEKDSGELYAWFLKVFNLGLSSENGENNNFKNGIIINSTVIEKEGEEIGKEIQIIRKNYKEYIFRDNNGNYSGKFEGNDNPYEENKQYENISQKNVCITLSFLNNDSFNKSYYDNKQEIDESYVKNKLIEQSDYLGIKKEIVFEYINFIKNFGKIEESLNDNQKKYLWLDNFKSIPQNYPITHNFGCMFYYIQKLCPIHHEEILLLLIDVMAADYREYVINQYGILKKFISSIESYGDSAYDYLNFCSAFEGSYIKNGIANIHGKFFGETLEGMRQRTAKKAYEESQSSTGYTPAEVDEEIFDFQNRQEYRSTFVQYFENFAIEPESVNLFSFLKENPQTLDNLGGKEINTINLSLDSGINFAFRGIIEMVKSRPDIDFPHLKENANEEDKQQRNQQREKIIKEYENMLRNYIAKDKQENSEGHEKTFDKIFFTKSLSQIEDSIEDRVANYMPSKEWAQQFSSNDVIDYSNDDYKYAENEDKSGGIKLISDVEKYIQQYPNAKILICINQHGDLDGSSGNGWSKEDRERLANLSPNIKIWSIRCYFGAAYNNKDIYDYQASLSGISNNTPGLANVGEIISDASNKNLGFHEMEIYTRLNYPVTVSPLTESMEYIDWNTGEKKIGKIGLAQNHDGQSEYLDNNYA